MGRLAIIGGTGVYNPDLLTEVREKSLMTPYGEMEYKIGFYKGKEIVFTTRHGSNHTIPPHKINFRANIYGLKMLGVCAIVATAAVGSLRENMKPGEMVLVDQLLDFTKSREHTFYDGAPFPVAHVDLTEPYCPVLRKLIWSAKQELDLPLHEHGTYVCTEGPRFETAAEIQMYKMLGGDVIGMTSVPECPLAREAEMSYATVAMVTNFGAGISPTPLTHSEVVRAMNDNSSNFQTLLKYVMENFDPDMDSPALHSMAEYGGFKVTK